MASSKLKVVRKIFAYSGFFILAVIVAFFLTFPYDALKDRAHLKAGETLLVQWFERARFEYHPNNPAPYKVLLGRLAADRVSAFGW